MGPDCGTAIVNGIPLGFANVVRRGDIGLVAASGTGLQEVTCRIHNLGAGVTQAIGTGGRDLRDEIGGISRCSPALAALAGDTGHARDRADVEAAVAGRGRRRILARPRPRASRRSWSFPRRRPASITRTACTARRSLAHAADIAVALARGERADAALTSRSPTKCGARSGDLARSMAPRVSSARARPLHRRHVLLRSAARFTAPRVCSAVLERPGAGRAARIDSRKSLEHVFIDMGDDEYTRGRPHPDDRSVAAQRAIRDEVADPTTAVVLFDVVLGYGSRRDPSADELADALRDAQGRGRAEGRQLAFDRPRLRHRRRSAGPRRADRAALESAGAIVAGSNIEAAVAAAAGADLAEREASRQR